MNARLSHLFIVFFLGIFVGMAVVGEVSKQIHSEIKDWNFVEAATTQLEQEMLFGSYIDYIVNHSVNWDTREVSILIDRSILRGSDAECEYFGQMMYYITGQGFTVYIENDGWIPTLKNPVDFEHAKILAQGY
jgi:hypothetical protein